MQRHTTRQKLIAALSIALLLSGCAHVRPADPTAAGTDLDDINARLAGCTARVRLADDTKLVAHDVRISSDSVSFRPQRFPGLESPWPAREVRELPTSEVYSIEVTNRSWGAADGALIGTVAGILAGAALGAAMNEADEGSIWSNETGALIGSGVFGVLGMGVGLLVGVGRGSTEVFDLTRAP